MHIICQWQIFGPDAHPVSAPDPICYEDCTHVATTRVTGRDFFDVDIFVCDLHTADAMMGLLDGATEPIDPLYARGYATAAAEADHVALTADQARYLLNEDEYPQGLEPTYGDTAGDLVLEGDGADQYEMGFLRGWSERLQERSVQLVRQTDEQTTA